MTEFRIAVLPGDGIGPDVIAEAGEVGVRGVVTGRVVVAGLRPSHCG